MWCLFGHHWKVVQVQHYNDTSYMRPGSPGLPSTTVTKVCTCCKKVKHRSYFGAGFIPLEHFK